MPVTKFDELYEKYVIKKETLSQIKDRFEELLSAIFEAHPTLKMLIFHGNTPSWNDGDACNHIENYALICDDGWLDCTGSIYTSFTEEDLSSKYGDKAESMIGKVLKFVGEDDAYIELPTDIGKNPKQAKGMDRVKSILAVQDFTHLIYDTNYVLSVILRSLKTFRTTM